MSSTVFFRDTFAASRIMVQISASSSGIAPQTLMAFFSTSAKAEEITPPDSMFMPLKYMDLTPARS